MTSSAWAHPREREKEREEEGGEENLSFFRLLLQACPLFPHLSFFLSLSPRIPLFRFLRLSFIFLLSYLLLARVPEDI